MSDHPEPRGLTLLEAVAADELQRGQIIVFDGHIASVSPVADDPDCVRIMLVPALGPPPGTNPDQRTIEVVCPRDMRFGTAAPHNISLAPWSGD
jgi:hypothetical protein